MINSGKVLINTRNIGPIYNMLNAKEAPEGAALNRLLSFLSMYVLSDGLIYDGSIPQAFLSPSLEKIEKLGIKKRVKSAKLPTEDNLAIEVEKALSLCHEQLHSVIYNAGQNHAPIKAQSATTFFEQVAKMKDTDARMDIALEATYRDLHGAKLLLALAGEQNEPILNQLLQNEYRLKQKQTLLSAMMGTFRTFYLSQVAGDNRGLYATDPQWVSLLEDHGQKIWGSLLREFDSSKTIKVTNDSDQGQWQYPVLGSAVLINAVHHGIKPSELLAYADKFRKEKKLKALSKELRRRFETTNQPEEIKDQINALWTEMIVEKLNKKDSQPILENLIFYVIIPALTIGMVSDQVWNNAICTGLATASPPLSHATVFFIKSQKKRHLSTISNLSEISHDAEGVFQENVNKLWRKN